MSSRKRNTPAIISSPRPASFAPPKPPGTRSSHVDGRPTTSTGTYSLDKILAGHGGFSLGNSLLVEENGTTDYSGVLLRYFAAEGAVQGHTVHIVGAGERWQYELPGVVGDAEAAADSSKDVKDNQKMKIAWRYERLGEFGSGDSVSPAPRRIPSEAQDSLSQTAFCHNFDLTKQLSIPTPSLFNCITFSPTVSDNDSGLVSILENLLSKLRKSPKDRIHRIVIPNFLSPLVYSQSFSQPEHIIKFFQGLRAILRQYFDQVCAMISLPLELFPRSSGLVRWMELLSDGVLEMAPFPHSVSMAAGSGRSGAATAQEDQPQGMLKVHRLPVFHERGGGSSGSRTSVDDLAFTVSRRKFVIKPFRLPPMEDGGDDQPGGRNESVSKPTKADLDF